MTNPNKFGCHGCDLAMREPDETTHPNLCTECLRQVPPDLAMPNLLAWVLTHRMWLRSVARCLCGGQKRDGLPRLDILCPVCDR